MKNLPMRVVRAGAALLASFALLGCGGGGGDDPTTEDAASQTPSAVEATWTKVADEGQSFTLSGTQTVRYGAGTRWVQRTLTNGGQCTNAFFGSDPASGVFKSCQVQGAQPPAGGQWTRIAVEGQAFTLSGTRVVRYGVDTRWVQRTLTNSGQCTNAFFGRDPANGVAKSCEVQSASNQAPVATITSPAANATFRAGDTITFSGSATDVEDGTLAAARLTWWAELHHGVHSHPFQAATVGATGTVTIPTRGETANDIFYRFHLRATDSAGGTHEVTRDIQPQKAQLTLTTAPAGLALTLDGQPITAPLVLTGVVGIERDLVAPASQNLNGRRYQFASWSDGGAATHTISTPVANTTYTATYTDIGPVSNNPPSVAITAPANNSAGTAGVAMTLAASASDTDGTITGVEFFENGAKIGATDTSSPYAVTWTPGTLGARTITARATDNGAAATTSVAIVVTIASPGGGDTQPPVATLSSPSNLATGLAGTLTLSATATDNVGVSGVEFHVDGVQIGATDTSAPYSATVDSNLYASGQHVIRTRARDAAGNVSTWATATVQFGGSRDQPAGFTRNETWITGLASSTAFAQSPDGRLFVAQQGGDLRIVKNGSLLPTPFVHLNADASGERGLIGVTLHPNFASNGFVYVYYTRINGAARNNRISRFTASGDVAGSGEQVLIDLPNLSSATNHNGGAMHFGNDGKLYVAVGDNNDSAKSPDLNQVFGKMLRFNDDGGIPSDNPFCTTAGTLRCAIWARGLRNPFTFAVRASDGRIHINDVGAGLWEEINLGVPGANYGWPATEGPTNAAGVTGPLFAYDHNASPSGLGGFFGGCAITGGAFYPDSGPFPTAYRGSYFFTDFCSPLIGRVDLANGNVAYAFGRSSGAPVGMLTGLDGALYVLTQGGITRFAAP